MQLAATDDVPNDRLEILAAQLRELVPVEVDEARTSYKSFEPPSWIALLEHIPTWAVIFGPSAAVFLNEPLRETAKDVYRNKAAIGRALASPVVGPLRSAAAAITRFRKAGGRTQILSAYPVLTSTSALVSDLRGKTRTLSRWNSRSSSSILEGFKLPLTTHSVVVHTSSVR